MRCRRATSPAPSKDRPKSKRPAQTKKDVGSKGSAQTAKRGGKQARDDSERRTAADDVASRGYGAAESAAIIQLQAFARKILAKRMLHAHRAGTSEHQRVQAELARATPQLQQQADQLASEILR
ncbi:uncharacterized protein LOC119092260 [Pollicipes pollicipes]|nr:uncharacterized protein LOC119092260 [Pollicipes pollicipes]